MDGVPVSIVGVIDMVAMRERDVAAALAVLVIVVFVDVLVGAHGSPSGQPLRATMTRGQGPDAVPDRPDYEPFGIRLSPVAPQLRWMYATWVSVNSSRPCLPSAPPMPDSRRPAWNPCMASKFSRLTQVSPYCSPSTAVSA